MTPLAMFGLGVPELLIILAVVLLLFGGSRLAGLGKSTGRALKEFKEETKGLKGAEGGPGAGPTAGNPYEVGADPRGQAQSGQTPQSGSPYGQTPPAGGPHNQAPSPSPYGQGPQDGTGTTGSGHDIRRDA